MPAIERLAEAGQSMFVPRASVIFTPGDTAEGAYVIMSGRVRLAIAPDNRAPVWSRTLVPGSVFGLAAAINGNTQILSATAEEDSVLIFVERSALIAAMREDAELGNEILRQMSLEVLDARKKVAMLGGVVAPGTYSGNVRHIS